MLLTDAVDEEDRNRIIYLLNYYNGISMRKQLLFHAYVQLPMIRCDDATNSAITLNRVERHTILGVYWGCVLNGNQFRDKTLNRSHCIRLRNTAVTNTQKYFSTHHTGWQLCYANDF